jgi:hypothetical protein
MHGFEGSQNSQDNQGKGRTVQSPAAHSIHPDIEHNSKSDTGNKDQGGPGKSRQMAHAPLA